MVCNLQAGLRHCERAGVFHFAPPLAIFAMSFAVCAMSVPSSRTHSTITITCSLFVIKTSLLFLLYLFYLFCINKTKTFCYICYFFVKSLCIFCGKFGKKNAQKRARFCLAFFARAGKRKRAFAFSVLARTKPPLLV